MRTLAPRFAATESLLLAGLLLLTAIALPNPAPADTREVSTLSDPLIRLMPDDFFRELLPTVLLCVALYWGLHFLGRRNPAFWIMAVLVLLPQMVVIWEHNRIEWLQFFDLKPVVEGDRSVFRDTGLFLVSLVGLAALYRTIGLRQLDRWMALQGIARGDRDRASRFEAVMLAGLVASALLFTLLMLALSALLGILDGPLRGSSWSVVTIGGGATVLLVLSLALWYRARRG